MMHVDRKNKIATVECDSCSYGEEMECDNHSDCAKLARKSGFVITRENDEWVHTCQDCIK